MPAIDYEIPLSYYALKLDGFSPVFRVGNHVLIEKFTGKTFVYKAVDLSTREIVSLFYTKTRLTEKKHGLAAEKMGARCEDGNDRPIAALKSEPELLSAKARVIFTHVLTRNGYKVREKQIELAEEMLAALRGNKILLSEAVVGIGKTHAYLIAAALHKLDAGNDFWIRTGYELTRYFHAGAPMPIVISTSSIALQRAITRDYIPEISRILLENKLIKRSLSCVVRKGKEHYICDARLRDYFPHADARTRAVLTPLLTDKTGARLDLGDMDSLTAHVKRKICVTGNCNLKCGCREQCRYLALLKEMQSGRYDFQVCNHQYLLADRIRREQGLRPLIPNYQAVIIDEAHKLEQAARTMYGTEVSGREVPALARHIEKLTFDDKRLTKSLKSYCGRLLKLNGQLFGALCAGVPATEGDEDAERFPAFITDGVKSAIRSLRCGLDTLYERLSGDPGVSRRQEGSLSHILHTLQKLSDRLRVFQSPGDVVCWMETPKLTRKVTGEVSLCCIPKRLGQYLYRDLWSKHFPVILTSGTLSAAGSFDHIKKRTGLDLARKERVLETIKPSPFDCEKNCLIYISEQVPFPDNKNPDYIKAVANEMERLITATQGHTAALFTSYRAMEQVYRIIEGRKLGYPLFKLDRGGGSALTRFRDSGNGVLFASGSMWEGIDLPGDILTSLIIVRLPFQVPDPLSEYEQSLYDNVEEFKRLVVRPDMLLKVKQGYGRNIRLESDTGVVSFFDYRMRPGGAYRDSVLCALPSCRVTNSVAEVESFIKTVKDITYFKGKEV